MPRSLTFTYKGSSFDAQLIKVARNQLYGTVRLRTEDKDGKRCSLATLASDGKTLIPKGGSALGYINTLGEWISRKELQPVSLEGEALEELPSSFDNPVMLDETQNVDNAEFLNHNIRLCYQLEAQDKFPKPFLQQLKKGTLMSFGFSYRGGITHDPAFILSDKSGVVWMLVSSVNKVEYVALEQAALCGGETIADEIDNDDEDNLDFGML